MNLRTLPTPSNVFGEHVYLFISTKTSFKSCCKLCDVWESVDENHTRVSKRHLTSVKSDSSSLQSCIKADIFIGIVRILIKTFFLILKIQNGLNRF